MIALQLVLRRPQLLSSGPARQNHRVPDVRRLGAICIDRLIPPAKARSDPVNLPSPTDSLPDNGRSVIQSLAERNLTPDEAGEAMHELIAQARIVEIDEIENA